MGVYVPVILPSKKPSMTEIRWNFLSAFGFHATKNLYGANIIVNAYTTV